MNNTNSRIRECILYEFRRNTPVPIAHQMLCQAMGNDVVSKRTVERWYKKFRSGHTDIKDDPRSGRPSAVDNVALANRIEENPALSTRQLANEFHVTHPTILQHLHNLNLVNKRPQQIPYSITPVQKQKRVEVCSDLLDRFEYHAFLDKIVTCDEKWIAYDNTKATNHWVPANAPPPTYPRMAAHGKKAMLSIWWCTTGVLYFEIVPQGLAINAETYIKQIEEVQRRIRSPAHAKQFRAGVLLLHDNARPHAALTTQQKLEELHWTVLPHPPYSPDIAPSDYHLFRSMEHFLRGRQMRNHKDVENVVSQFIASQKAEFWKKGIEKLPELWKTIVESNGNYIL